MAKSKNGGARAYLRGRIGSDVYSIGKNGNGAKQQVVRSLAESVANPRTSSQMFGRMIMSTVMQAVSAFKPIIDHSFDGFPVGQPSISEFIRQNYALVKADATDHPASGNKFGLKKYQEKGLTSGKYKVSSGTLVKPSSVNAQDGALIIQVTGESLTIGALRSALGISDKGYVTIVAVGSNGTAGYARVQLTTTLADETVITAENVASLFTIEGNVTPTVSLSGSNISFSLGSRYEDGDSGVIMSDQVDGAWKHSTCSLANGTVGDYTADVALPTYPVGDAQFLNGGDL